MSKDFLRNMSRIKKGLEKAGHEVKAGTEKAGHEVKAGSEYAGHEVKTGVKSVFDKLKKPFQKSEK